MSPKQKLLKFHSTGAKKDSQDGPIEDQGKIGDLNYEVYSRGVIHIYDKKLIFKKDCGLFEDEMNKLDFESMVEGDNHIIKGSGTNDSLVFFCEEGEIKAKLSKRGNDMIEKLKKVLQKGRK